MQAHAAEAAEAPVVGVEIDCTVVAGRGLVAKDRSLLGKKSSDPYVVISCGKRMLGTTKVVDKSLSPVWDQAFKLNLNAKAAAHLDSTELVDRRYLYPTELPPTQPRPLDNPSAPTNP